VTNIRFKVTRYRYLPAAYRYEVFSGVDDWGAGRRFGWRARERAIDKARRIVLDVAITVKPVSGAAE
jgi:hypothetical protein